jgi:long-chain fatty acid transport protein
LPNKTAGRFLSPEGSGNDQKLGHFMMARQRSLLSLMVVTGLSTGMLAGSALPSFAGAFALREQSAQGQGMSFAGVAAGGGGLGSMFWNPATMTDYPGITSSFVLTGIMPNGFIRPSPFTPTAIFGRSDTQVIDNGLVPGAYGAYQFNEQIWLGVSVNSPFGLMSRPGFNWAGQVYGRSARVFSLEVSPSAAYKINDWISVAVGLQVEYFKARLNQAVGIFPNAPSAILDADDTGIGYTAGVTLKPTAWTEAGIGFRSMVHESLAGSLTTLAGALPAKANVNLPEQVTAGVRQMITNDWAVLGGFEWTNWSRLGIVPVTTAGFPVTAVPFKYKDGYTASLGVEYAWSPALTLRAGLAYEWSPIDVSNRTVLLPDSDRIWASVGLTYHISNKLTFDGGYSHGELTKGKIQILPGSTQFALVGLPFVADTKHARFDIFSGSLTYRWDDTSQTIPVTQPIIRKY